jgi:PAS domain S-box-containing protein
MVGDSSASGSKARLYRLIFEEATEAIVALDREGRLLASNRAARELPGVNLAELFGRTRGDDADLAFLRAQLRVGGRGSAELRVRESTHGPRVLVLEGRAHGSTHVVVMRDVTDARRVDEELRRLRHFEDMGRLTASAIHDFNNVLTAIVCATSLLEADVAGQERASLMAREIRAASERGTRLVSQALSRLRGQASKLEPLHLGHILDDARPLLEIVVGPRVEIGVDIDPSLGETLVDREQLDHVILSLAANARDAMPNGGKLSIAAANVPGDEAGAAAPPPSKGAYVSLRIADTGVGIAPDVRERVFERLYTTKPTDRGSGRGLATAYRFVKRSGGCIAVRGGPGQGTAIVMYLPRALPIPRGTRPLRVSAERPKGNELHGSETILLIESDDAVRGAVCAVLRESGYRVVDAPSGDVAIRQGIAAAPIELVVADLGAQGPSGRDVVARLRAAGHSPRLLWTSGAPERSVSEHLGEDQYLLRKAFTPLELLRRIRDVLDSGRAESSGQGSSSS